MSVAPSPVLVLMGVSGCGKSTVAAILARQLGWTVGEGDDMHPTANVEKMRSGQPLTDEDRWPWLRRVSEWITEQQRESKPAIVTCSALRKAYRDILRADGVVFVHLAGSRETIEKRMAVRQGHFMPASLLDSQFATLEPLEADESGLVVELTGSAQAHAAEIIRRLDLTATP